MGDTVADKGSRDLYAVLGVSPTATEDEIKRAFRRLAAEHHPDRNPDDKRAATRFKRINAAYQVLSDPAERAAYDRLTQPIDEDEPSRAERPSNTRESRRGDSAPKTPPREQSRQSAEPPRERELVRDARIVVTDRRVRFPAKEYLFASLAGARLVHHGRNHFLLLFVPLAFLLVALIAESSSTNRGTWFAVLSLGGVLIRYVGYTTKYYVRLRNHRGHEHDAIESTSAAWASDVVRAIDDGIARVNPDGHVGRRPAVAKESSNQQMAEAFGMSVGFGVAALVVGAVFPKQPSPTSTPDYEPRSYAPAPTPSPTRVAPPTMTYVVQPGDSWGAIAYAGGISAYELAAMNYATVDTTIHPGDVIRVPAGTRVPPPSYGTAANRTQTRPSWAAPTIVNTVTPAGTLVRDDSVLSAATTTTATPTTPRTPTIRTWHCADGSLAYGRSADLCRNNGGLDPQIGSPTVSPSE